MLNFVVSVSIFALVYSSPAKNDLQKILRHLDRGDDHLHKVLKDTVSVSGEDTSSGCACHSYNCGCCAHLKWKPIHLDDGVCANFSYLPAPIYGISVTLTVDTTTILNKTVSVHDPPALCVAIPELKKLASLCIKFKGLEYSNHSLSGCVFIIAELAGVKLEEIKIGCFKIPPGNGTLAPRLASDLEKIMTGKLARKMGPGYDNKHNRNFKLYFEPSGKHKIEN